ncbi:MAG: preprotein translocase subunit SecE [Pelagibacterales bacterium]|jgi:preprotein translocase subunit SecE|nr:preprotein translocase subunit SecE [Pelagibacterales bacterium]|tara:strand:+ start:336 stop:524 length:189 start_codon:yes stop_codon:yes gene_type:complete
MKPLRFLQEVRREGGKVTWPSSRETLTGSIMVVIMVAIASVFFLIIDQIFSFGLDKVIGIGI